MLKFFFFLFFFVSCLNTDLALDKAKNYYLKKFFYSSFKDLLFKVPAFVNNNSFYKGTNCLGDT